MFNTGKLIGPKERLLVIEGSIPLPTLSVVRSSRQCGERLGEFFFLDNKEGTDPSITNKYSLIGPNVICIFSCTGVGDTTL